MKQTTINVHTKFQIAPVDPRLFGGFLEHLGRAVYEGVFEPGSSHADVVKIANLAQIVNVIAPILTRGDELLIQSIYYPFEMMSKRRKGDSLRVVVDGPSYEGATNGSVHYIDTSAILGEGALHVFLTNRSMDEASEVCIGVADSAIVSSESAELLTGPSPRATNSFEDSDVIKAIPFEDVSIQHGQARCELPPLSFVAMTLKLG